MDHDPVAELPPYRALLAVDMKDFSGAPGRQHRLLTESIPQILRSAFISADLGHEWDRATLRRSTGDGYVLLARPAILPFLLNPFLRVLQAELVAVNRSSLARQAGRPIRMRASVHVGPVDDSGAGEDGDGSGAVRVETHRLLDAQVLKDLLARSSEATCVVAVVSGRAFEDAVLSGYCGEAPEYYVESSVQVKSYEGTAYLRVPEPSGGLLSAGFPTAAQPVSTREATVSATDSPTVGTIYGPVHQGSGTQTNDLSRAYRWDSGRDR
jgi:hypothetical protein